MTTATFFHSRLTMICAIAMLLFVAVACTRERPASEETPTAAVTEIGLTPGATPTPAPVDGSGEPEVTAAPTLEIEAEGTAAPGETTTGEYEVQSGDTLFSVAQKFDTTPQTIRELNFLVGDIIQVGQRLIVPVVPLEPTPTPAPFIHVVQAGETLSQIAQRYGISQVDIIQTNQIVNPNTLSAGTELVIPGYQATQPAAESSSETGSGAAAGNSPADGADPYSHIVQPGETLSEIAQQYGVDANAIANANNLANRNQLRAGQALVIPGLTQAQARDLRQIRHTVKAGETLLSISREYGVEARVIQTANNLTDPNAIFVGQVLLIPQE
jgi:LysM repeat protein